MPNWVTCRFQTISNTAQFKEIAVNPKTGDIDFNILLPMPETLNITAPPQGKMPDDFTFPENTQLDRYLQECVDKKCSVGLALAHWNKVKYGVTDWYDWRIAHWGTKWNACESFTDTDTGMPDFQTAWSMPDGWLRTLAEHIDFTFLYADEEMGQNCGRVVASNGTFYVESPSTDAEGIALAYYIHHGDAAKEVMEEDNRNNPDYEALQNALDNYEKLIENWV